MQRLMKSWHMNSPNPPRLKSRSQRQSPHFSSREEVFSPEQKSRLPDMPVSSALFWVLALLLLQEASLDAPIENQTVVEGQDLDLHCVVAGDNTSSLQWTDPRYSVLFHDHQKGLKDNRYKLLNSSKDRLSIRLANTTTDDEGVYTCHHYTAAATTKLVNVIVLAAPSKPLLEEFPIRVHGGEENIILKCSTWGSKPPPQITWLLDNGIELFGDTRHQCEGNGKKYNSTSTLTVHTFNQKSTMTCVIRHKALGSGNLTATVYLSHTRNILNITEGNFRTQRLSPNSELDTPNSTNNSGMSSKSDSVFNTTEQNFGAHETSASNETMTQNPNSTTGSGNGFNITQGNSSTAASPTSDKAGALNFTATNNPDKILNVTDRNSSTQTPSPSPEAAATLNFNMTSGTNLTRERIVETTSKLLPILVAALLSVLFVAVLLFSVKLWKAHREWKRENDSSDLTLESYKVRPNEDNPKQENRHVIGWKSSMKRAAEGSWRTSSKNSEESNGSVFEKQLPYIRETDL
ncbi:cytotoxic and regulatory T-cell molecule [Paroedura picta]|uniref:cytotoxic and regulatory T-cell molecule n=1 Tax=Paroedura picta TaxID=143630 RepID=UPI0040579A45